MSEISICIPTYEYGGDGVKYLSELFDTLRVQTLQDFNIVVSDHSIDDEIYDFCKKSGEEFEITYVRNHYGRGYQSPNTNCAINIASGRIIKLIYQDDIFVDPQALQKLKERFDSGCKWLLHGFTHTTDCIETHRDCAPKWTERMLEGNNQLGSPSCVAFLRESKMEMDEEIKLLIDTDLYHRMRMEYGMPEIMDDVLIANREHDNRVSGGGVDYDTMLEDSTGKRWVVNSKELEHLYKKHSDFFKTRKYPDEA